MWLCTRTLVVLVCTRAKELLYKRRKRGAVSSAEGVYEGTVCVPADSSSNTLRKLRHDEPPATTLNAADKCVTTGNGSVVDKISVGDRLHFRVTYSVYYGNTTRKGLVQGERVSAGTWNLPNM